MRACLSKAYLQSPIFNDDDLPSCFHEEIILGPRRTRNANIQFHCLTIIPLGKLISYGPPVFRFQGEEGEFLF